MSKKFLSMTLALILLLSCVGGTCASADTEITNEIMHKCDVLSALKIVNPRAMGDYGATEISLLNDRSLGDYGIFRNISKSAFINYLCNMYGDYGFTDDYSEKAVGIAESYGVIHKGQTDLTKPLYYDEAATMLVRFLGYGAHAEQSGGYPNGYIMIANRLGLTDGVSATSGQRLQDLDAIILLYNAINVGYAQLERISSEYGPIYAVESDKTFLYEFRKIYKIEGVVEATETAELRLGTQMKKDCVMISGDTYKAKEDFEEHLGLNVEAYVQEGNGTYDEVLFMFPRYNQELTIKADNILDISADFRKLSYYDESDRTKELSISAIAKVLYNGQPLKTNTEAAFKPDEGEIRLIDSNDDSVYDTVLITDLKTVVVDSVSGMSEKIINTYTHDAENINLELEAADGDVVKIIGEKGTLKFSDIKKDDVLLTAQSVVDGRKHITIKVSDKKIAGAVMAVANGIRTTISVDGAEYQLSRAYEAAIAANDAKAETLAVGKIYTFYLDAEGRIAFAKADDGSVKYGIPIATTKNGVFEPKCFVKLCTSEGEFKIFELAERLEFDEADNQRAADVIDHIPLPSNEGVSVIKYNINAQGLINYIDLADAYDNGNNSEFNILDKADRRYRAGNSSFDSSLFAENTNLCWDVNLDEPLDEDSYSLRSEAFEQDVLYSVAAYNIDEYGFAEIMVVYTSNSSKTKFERTRLFLVDEVVRTLNSDGDAVYLISGLSGNAEFERVSYYCRDAAIIDGTATWQGANDASGNPTILDIGVSPGNPLSRGDIIALHADKLGYVDAVTRYCTAAIAAGSIEGFRSGPANAAQVHALQTIIKGEVKKTDVDGDRIKVNCGGEDLTMRVSKNTTIMIYDAKMDKLIKGKLDDVEQGDRIVAKLSWSEHMGIVVYKNAQ